MSEDKKVLLEVQKVKKEFVTSKSLTGKPLKIVHAVDSVDLTIYEGETIGVVGESGCGKSTLGRCILQLIRPTAGNVLYRGEDITKLNKEQMRQMRRKMQLIFQDPYASLNPRMTVLELIMAPLEAFGIGTMEERVQRVKEIMELVGMPENMMNRYPHEFSGGQRQRIVIARALVLNPEFVVCDEPVSALDVSVRAQVLNLIQELKKKKHLTYMFISHDLNVVHHMCHRVIVMYLGRIVEMADVDELYDHPCHPYTRMLFDSILTDEEKETTDSVTVNEILPGTVDGDGGCPFYGRCRYAGENCLSEVPTLTDIGTPGHPHLVRCERIAYGEKYTAAD